MRYVSTVSIWIYWGNMSLSNRFNCRLTRANQEEKKGRKGIDTSACFLGEREEFGCCWLSKGCSPYESSSWDEGLALHEFQDYISFLFKGWWWRTTSKKTNLSFLALRITVKISASANLSLPPEAAEVGHVILTQAQEQISGFGALLFEVS